MSLGQVLLPAATQLINQRLSDKHHASELPKTIEKLAELDSDPSFIVGKSGAGNVTAVKADSGWAKRLKPLVQSYAMVKSTCSQGFLDTQMEHITSIEASLAGRVARYHESHSTLFYINIAEVITLIANHFKEGYT